MSRQINLYSPSFRRQTKTFSAVWVVVAVLVVAAVMSADYAWEAHRLQDTRARRSEAAGQLAPLREQLVTLGKVVQKPSNKALEAQVAQSERVLGSRQELFARLQGGEIGNRDGYAKFLAALARQRVEGVWLTGIEISGPGNDFALEGRTVRADLLPGFIKRLRNEEAFRGKPIGMLALHERQLDPKGEPEGGVAGAPAQSGQGGPSPGVRVVEFRIGASAAGGAGATGVASGAGGAGR
jgi:hypothetical protein